MTDDLVNTSNTASPDDVAGTFDALADKSHEADTAIAKPDTNPGTNLDAESATPMAIEPAPKPEPPTALEPEPESEPATTAESAAMQVKPTEKPLDDVAATINKTISSVANSINKDDLTKFAGKARETISSGASQGANTVMEGFEAVRDVRRAVKQTNAARTRLKQVQDELAENSALLAHREEVAQNYTDIIDNQTTLRIEAQNHMKKLSQIIADKQAEEEKLRQKLATLRETHRQDLRPHKAKLEQAQDKVDEATKAVADAKRALKLAESQHKDVVGRRDEEINYVKQSIEKSTAHIEELNDELATLTASDSADKNALKHTRKAIAKEERALDRFHNDIADVTEQHRRAIENALTHLYTQRNSLDFAQETLEDAKREADERKANYDKLFKDAHGRESEVDKQIAALTKAITDTQKQLDDATARRDNAQSLIDEAKEIHATPELTEELRNTISDTQAAIEVQQRQVQNLEKREAKLREKTKQQRYIFIGVLCAAGFIILLVLLSLAHVL
ncbi:hypothetical protein [Atopobium minutum]|uniref:hypothetical protein n=1 Tax=Atopobium minutum TaxID=1381 RepID=UPI0025E8B8A4|nr:hypothetical protein [Atopobium minutum]